MTEWDERDVALKFGVGDRVWFTHCLRLRVRAFGLGELAAPVAAPAAPSIALQPGCAGFYLRSLPVASAVPRLTIEAGWLRYVVAEYSRCYIDLAGGLEAYRAKFSPKTRSTINRKIRKFRDHCAGTLQCSTYDQPQAMTEFHRLARTVSSKTYQERLLDAGIPDGTAFVEDMVAKAGQGRARGYLLFDRDRPVAYLYCPVVGDAFVYAYLGYDPAYAKLSVGTVLQWLALEDMFARPAARYFDFTEGQSEHKRLFATHESSCINVMFVRPEWSCRLWLGLHARSQALSSWLGVVAQRWGLKAKIRRAMRFGIASRSAPST